MLKLSYLIVEIESKRFGLAKYEAPNEMANYEQAALAGLIIFISSFIRLEHICVRSKP
jgi:hypothetical protein